MSRWYDAVVDCGILYARLEGLAIWSYDVTSPSWSQLPFCPYLNGSITVINGRLTTIGGISNSLAHSNALFSLTGEGSDRRWTKKFPSMPTKRCDTTAVCTGTTLIVVGGRGEGDIVLSTIELMNTENHQWSTAADLLEPMYLASATICEDQIYMLGGVDKDGKYTKSVYTCSVTALLQSCVQSSLNAKLKRTFSVEKVSMIWRQVADLPVICSTCESFHGRLLAIGGRDSGKPTTAVYMYNSTTDSWEVISHMITARYDCFTAVLPDDRLMVVGGVTDHGKTVTVELARYM